MYDNNTEVCDNCLIKNGVATEWKKERLIYPYKGGCLDCGLRTKKLWKITPTNEGKRK